MKASLTITSAILLTNATPAHPLADHTATVYRLATQIGALSRSIHPLDMPQPLGYAEQVLAGMEPGRPPFHEIAQKTMQKNDDVLTDPRFVRHHASQITRRVYAPPPILTPRHVMLPAIPGNNLIHMPSEQSARPSSADVLTRIDGAIPEYTANMPSTLR